MNKFIKEIIKFMLDMFRPRICKCEEDMQCTDVNVSETVDILKSQLVEKSKELEVFKKSVEIKDMAASMGATAEKLDGIVRLADMSSETRDAVESVKKDYPELFFSKVSSAKVGAFASGESSVFPDYSKMTQTEYNKHRKNSK